MVAGFVPVANAPGYLINQDAVLLDTTGRVLRGELDRGYVRVWMYIHGKRVKRRLHHLMLETFVGPRPPGMEGRHLDDVKSHNRITNLVWGTPEQNYEDGVRNGTLPPKEHYPTVQWVDDI